MRLVFMGTPALAVPCLDALREDHDIALVVTQPDKPSGRGNKLMPSAVKARALELDLPIAQPEKARDSEFLEQLRKARPEGIAVVAYGQILPNAILEMPREFHPHGGCVNLHYSLLPRWRGAAPVQHALLYGDTVTGVTCQHMAQKLDAGDIILQREVPVDPNETTGELWERLTPIGADALREAMRLLKSGTAPRLPQDEAGITFAPTLQKEAGRLDWNQSALNLHNKVRALNPWPGAWCLWRGEVLKLWRASFSHDFPALPPGATPGTFMGEASGELLIATSEGVLRLREVQAPSKPRMPATSWARGVRLTVGDKFD